MKAKPVTLYHAAAPETWTLIRAAYLSGLSAPTVAARFGVTVSAIRKRAMREGWTKQALAKTRAAAFDAPRADAADDPRRPPTRVDPMALARHALLSAAQALAEGRGAQARSLALAAETIARLNDLIPADIDPETPEQIEARQRYFEDCVFELGCEVAEGMARGGYIPPSLKNRVEAWRRKHGFDPAFPPEP